MLSSYLCKGKKITWMGGCMPSLPVKVLQIGMTRNHGGLETYLLQQFRAIDRTKVIYDFVNITGEYDIVAQDEILASGSKVYAVNSRHLNPIKHYYQWIKLLAKVHSDYNAIVLNTNSLEYIFPLLAAVFFGIPKRVIHSHNMGYERKIGFYRRILIAFNKVLLKQSATHYFACSKAAGKWMFGDKDFTVIHNAIQPRDFMHNGITRNFVRKKLGLQDCFVVGHVGRFSYQKNHKFLIQIFSEIVKKQKNAMLMLIGNYVGDDFYWRQCHEIVNELQLSEKVLFLGERKDVPDLMQAMDCFVLPSHFEGLPLVGIEAQAAGLLCFFSVNITKELAVTDLVHFLSFKQPASHWAEQILYIFKTYKALSFREHDFNTITEKGYNIEYEIKKIEKFYCK